MSLARDPEGKPLTSIVLRVRNSDHRGPTTLEVLHDTDVVAPQAGDQFMIVWAADAPNLGTSRFSTMFEELTKLKAIQTEMRVEIEAQHGAVASIQRAAGQLEEENAQKTEALRALQKERDPERQATTVRDAVEAATADLQAELKTTRAAHAELERLIAELRASKKKLKEAYDRLKAGREAGR